MLPREGQWTLAGGATTGHHKPQDNVRPDRVLEESRIPAGMQSLFCSTIPVVAPPANVQHPNGDVSYPVTLVI